MTVESISDPTDVALKRVSAVLDVIGGLYILFLIDKLCGGPAAAQVEKWREQYKTRSKRLLERQQARAAIKCPPDENAPYRQR